MDGTQIFAALFLTALFFLWVGLWLGGIWTGKKIRQHIEKKNTSRIVKRNND